MKTKLFKWYAILLIGLTGCYDYSNFDFDKIAFESFSPSYVFPLVKDSITLREILEQSDSIEFIQENADNSYSILYRDTVDAGFATDQFSIPGQTFNQTVTVPGVPIVANPPIATFPFDESYDETLTTTTEPGSNFELKRIDLTGGTLQIVVTNNFRHNVTGKIILISLKNAQGDSLVLPDFTLNGLGTVYTNTIQLSDYYFDSYNNLNNQYNDLNYRVIGSLTTTNNPVNAGDNVSVQVSIVNPVFNKATGKINYSFVQPEQSYNVDLYEASSNIQQHLADPKLTLQFINSYGIPAAATFTKFEFVNESSTIPLTTTGTNIDDLKIGSPNTITHITGSQTTASTTLKLNKDNSNIVTAFNSTPKSINFGARFDLGDNTTNHDYFVNQSSTIKLISEIEIPIYGWAKVNLSDTLSDLELTSLDSIDNVDVSEAEITVTFLIKNQLPLNIYLQATFLDDADQELTSLFDAEELLIKSANVDANGVSTNTATKKTDIRVTKAKYELMSQATKMIISYRLVTGGNDMQSIKILSTNKIGIQASISVKGTIKPEL